MLKRLQFWSLSTIGLGCVVFAILNMVLYSGNQNLRTQVSNRQQYIQQSLQLQNLYREIVQTMVDLSVHNHDAQLKAILNRQGIKVHPQAAANPAPAATSTNTKKRPRAHRP